MIESGRYISTGTCEIPYLLSDEVKSMKELQFFTPEQFKQQFDVVVLIETLVVNINPRQRTLELLRGEVKYFIDYDRLVLATGAENRLHPSLQKGKDNVFYLRNIEDMEQILRLTSRSGGKWCIIGASFSGIEFADSLIKSGNEVVLIDNNDLPASGFDREVRELIRDNLLKNGVEFYPNISDFKVFGSDNKINKIKIDGRLKEIDYFIVSIGVEPRINLAKLAGLEIGTFGGIKVDRRMRTSDPYIFAAGDCVEVKEKISGRYFYLPQATLARDGGHIAGGNAAGGNLFFYPVIRNTTLRVIDKFASKVGLTEEELRFLNIPFRTVSAVSDAIIRVMPGHHKVFGKIIYGDDGRILGAGFFGGTEVSGYSDVIALSIKAGITISDLRNCNFNYTPTLSPFKNIIEMLSLKATRNNK
jgi:NADPH-dependent 2,4-dienoyl-CoA reductase/sulfur reductase-like enzyme